MILYLGSLTVALFWYESRELLYQKSCTGKIKKISVVKIEALCCGPMVNMFLQYFYVVNLRCSAD